MLPAYDVFVLQWTILQKRRWARADGGVGCKCRTERAAMDGMQMPLFKAWMKAWGRGEMDKWGI